MSQILVTGPLLSQFEAADTPLEICNYSGQLLGYFTPIKSVKYDWEPKISEEELDRRQAKGGGTGRPLEEILKELRSRS